MNRTVSIAIECFIASGCAVAIAAFAWLRFSPLTICLTFDDGSRAQATVAAPCLERHGWRGAFNLVTGRIENPKATYLQMTWAQANELCKRGHELYPHSYMPDPTTKSYSHYNLRVLAERGMTDELTRQIVESRKQLSLMTGSDCRFFCLPFNACNETVASIIRANGMEPMNCDRRNFPTHPGRQPMSISDYVKDEYRKGTRHVDIMMHGIVRKEGGWEPFEDAAHFERFCDELKSVEKAGIVRVVPYAASHRTPVY